MFKHKHSNKCKCMIASDFFKEYSPLLVVLDKYFSTEFLGDRNTAELPASAEFLKDFKVYSGREPQCQGFKLSNNPSYCFRHSATVPVDDAWRSAGLESKPLFSVAIILPLSHRFH